MSSRDERAVVFTCEGDDLVGILHPGDEPLGVLVVVGGPQYRVGSHRQFTLMARRFSSAGHPVLRFDYRGMGDSAGASRSFADVANDIQAAIDAFFQEVPTLRQVVLWGLCDGASAILLGPLADPRIGGLILANPWVRTAAGEAQTYLKHYYIRRVLQRDFWAKLVAGDVNPVGSLISLLRHVWQAKVAGAAANETTRTGFVERMQHGLVGFRRPVLVLLSGRDFTAREFADLCRTQEEWRRAVGAVEIVDLPEADHTFSERPSLDAAIVLCLSRLATWSRAPK